MPAKPRDSAEAAFSLILPGIFSSDDTSDALLIASEELAVTVADSRLRIELASADAALPLHFVLQVGGNLALSILGAAGWSAITAMYRRFKERFPNRPISIELRASNDDGCIAEYLLSNVNDKALTAISADLRRAVTGQRIAYDVDEGWMTWEEFQAFKRRRRDK